MSINYSDIRKQFTKQEKGHKPPLSRKTENAFNYAACIFPFLYNLIYKRIPLAITFIILTSIPHIICLFVPAALYLTIVWLVSIITVVLAIYSGKTGNKDVYKVRDYDDEEDFLNHQKGWFIAAMIMLVIHIFILPVQINGHYNTSKMITLSYAKNELKNAMIKGKNDGKIIGVNIYNEDIIPFFTKYIDGTFDSENGTITGKNKYTYKIEPYEQECSKRSENTYHGENTACGKVYIDINGKKGPNTPASNENGDGVKELSNNTKKLKDIFALYIYGDDLAPKEGSIEEFAFKKFERK